MNRYRSALLIALFGLFMSHAQAYTLGPESTSGIWKWWAPIYETGASITWSFIDTSVAISGGACSSCNESSTTAISSVMPAGYMDEIRRAFSTWAAVADLTFTEVADGGAAVGVGTTADIRIGALGIDGPTDTLGFGWYPPQDGNVSPFSGDVMLDREENWTVGADQSGEIDIFSIVLHELGHALGLGHSVDTTAVMYPYYTSGSALSGLGADDIAGIQYLYGSASVASVPVPAAVWLMLSGLGLISFFSKKQRT